LIVLGGQYVSHNTLFFLQEDHDEGHSIQPGDEMYLEMDFDGTVGSIAGDKVLDVINVSGQLYAGSANGKTFRLGPGGIWFRHGTLDINGSWQDLEPTTTLDYVAVGANGNIARSLNGANPVSIPSNTTNHLRAVEFLGSSSFRPDLLAVGDSGVFLRSEDDGASWLVQDDGLIGNNYGLHARGTTTTTYEAWVSGDQGRIQFRPRTMTADPFMSFYPGRLDFGFLTLGQSRTLPVAITNRGGEPLQVSSISIAGTGFSLVQSDIDEISSGDTVTLLARYKPTAASSNDIGEITFVTNDEDGTYTLPLVGRASSREWHPVSLRDENGTPINGQVVALSFDTNTTGYAVVGLGRLWHLLPPHVSGSR
jgi:hypothetical protein